MATLLLPTACDQQNQYVPPPPAKVTVALPLKRPVTLYLEATGNTAAFNSVDLVARVQGFLSEINYQDGAPVKRGTVLFVIEPDPWKVRLDQAQAAEAGAEATLRQTTAEYNRQAQLGKNQFASGSVVDQALATRDQARSALQQAHANTQLAAINYDYTHVAAPFDGIVTAHLVSVGELVGGGTTPTQLATIVQLDPIYVNFNISEQDLLRIRADMRARGVTPAELLAVPVEVGLQTENGYPHKGVFDYAAPIVNAATGTFAVRGRFDNHDRALLPGNFVRVRVPMLGQTESLLVPDAVLGTDQGGRYLLVVNGENVVEQRKVTLGPIVDDLRVIEQGLKPDERVVVGGMLRAIPGQKVEPQTQTASAPATTGAN